MYRVPHDDDANTDISQFIIVSFSFYQAQAYLFFACICIFFKKSVRFKIVLTSPLYNKSFLFCIIEREVTIDESG